MLPDQEFLASFGVDIDESGVNRLQQILTENKSLGADLAASFNAAAEGVKAFKESISTELPSLFGGGYGNVTENLVMNIAGQVLTFLGLIGVIVDPTTAGVGDSERALGYEEPWEDKL